MKMARLMAGMGGVGWMGGGIGLLLATAAMAGDWSGSFNLNNGGGFSTGGCGPGGLSIQGSYRGGRWSGDFHVNSGWGGWDPRPSGRVIGSWSYVGTGYSTWDFYPRYGSYYDYWYWNRYRYGYRPYGWATGPIEGRGGGPVDWSLLPGVAPQPRPVGEPDAPPPPPPTKLELAHAALAERRFDDARAAFGAHLAAQPDDTVVMRELAMCLIESREIESGLAMLRDLYVKDLSLVEKPYAGELAGQGANRVRDMVARVTTQAHKVKSPSAWLGVVVLMQAEGRKAPALKMLDRAKDAGLERAVVEKFAATLTPPPVVKAKPTKPATPTPAPTHPAAPAAPQAPAGAVPGEAPAAAPSGDAGALTEVPAGR